MSLYGTLDGNLVRGRSAYELACMNGYTGTEKEWLETLKGEPGEKGETGDPGVYIGTDEPTDEDVRVWVDPDGGADELPGLKYVKDDPSDHGGVIEGWVNLPENPPAGMYINKASGNCSHAEGYGTIASGQWSHAENAFNTADGEAAHAEGYQTEAHGADSHSEGQYTKARSHASHAEGVSTTALNTAAHAEGSGTVARGQNSHCEGLGTIAAGQNQHVQGKYNVEDTNNIYAMIVGNGTGDNDRSNAFAVKWDGTIVFGNGSEFNQFVVNVEQYDSQPYMRSDKTYAQITAIVEAEIFPVVKYIDRTTEYPRPDFNGMYPYAGKLNDGERDYHHFTRASMHIDGGGNALCTFDDIMFFDDGEIRADSNSVQMT